MYENSNQWRIFFVSVLQERKHKQPHTTQNQINKALNQLICVLYYY